MLSIKSAPEVASALAQRVRERRLQRGWTQAEMAERAGIKLPTYIAFERTGNVSLLRLLKILDIVDLMDQIDAIGRGIDYAGMNLEDIVKPKRKRGRHTRS